MKTLRRVVRIPTKEYSFEEIEVIQTFEDEVKDVDAWFKIDETVNFKKSMIENELEMDREFANVPKNPQNSPVGGIGTSVSTTPSATVNTTQPATQICTIHNEVMQGREGKYGYFYSHKNGAGWCNGKAKGYGI